MNPKAILKDYKTTFHSNRKKQREEFTFWVKSTYIFMLAVMSSLVIYYVWILNVNATQGYNIRQLEIEKSTLLMEKELLDVKIAELESLDNILNSEDIKGMEKVEDPEFLVIKNNIQYSYNY